MQTESRTVEFMNHWGTRVVVYLDDVMFGKPWTTNTNGENGCRASRALLPREIRAMLPRGPFDTD